MKLITLRLVISVLAYLLAYSASMQSALGAPKKSAKTPVPAAVELLCPAGDDKAEDAKKRTKLCKMLQNIARGGKIDAVDKKGQTALMYAAELNERLAVCWLVAKGADVTLKDKDGKSAQDLAHTIAQRELLDLSAQTPANAAGALTLNDSTTPEQIALMVRRGGDVNTSDAESWVMKQESTSPARLLLALGLKGSGDSFPLYSAIIHNDVKKVEKLLKANPKLKETPKDTPGLLSYAQSGEMVRTLVAAGAVATIKDLYAALDKDASIVRELIAAGAPTSAPGYLGSILCHVDNGDIIDILVQSGVDPNKGNPLLSAIQELKLNAVQALLKNGAKVDRKCMQALFPTYLNPEEYIEQESTRERIDRYANKPQILAELIRAGGIVDEQFWKGSIPPNR